MAVGEAREEVRPRDRTGIGVGDVDLDLRNDDESAGERERELRRREHVAERRPDTSAWARRRSVGGTRCCDGEKSQERPRQHLHARRGRSSRDRRTNRRSTSSAAHALRGGRNRRKSTCSPICAISENTTVAAVPNSTRSNSAHRRSRPGKVGPCVERLRPANAMKTKGRRCSTIQTGCVHSCSRLMKVMPWVTNGMTISELRHVARRTAECRSTSPAQAT